MPQKVLLKKKLKKVEKRIFPWVSYVLGFFVSVIIFLILGNVDFTNTWFFAAYLSLGLNVHLQFQYYGKSDTGLDPDDFWKAFFGSLLLVPIAGLVAYGIRWLHII